MDVELRRELLLICLVFILLCDSHFVFSAGFKRHGGGTNITQSIQIIALSSSGTTTGLSSGSTIGTLSVTLNPIFPTFSYVGTNLHLSTTGVDSGGVCNSTNGAGNGSFQILNGDTLATNGTLTAGSKAICVAASESGVPSTGQAFTISVGNLIDAAASYCASNGGGNGTSATPWHAACIQAAVNAAVVGDTVFLAGGNWVLNGTDTTFVSVNKAINLVGAGSGNTFDAQGHINNASGADLCPVTGASITCIYQTGTSQVNVCGGPAAGWMQFGLVQDPCTATSTSLSPTCVNINVSHVFFDGSPVTQGGDTRGLVTIYSCTGPIVFDDIRHLAYNVVAVANAEGQFVPLQSNGVTLQNSLFAVPLTSGSYPGSQALQMNGQNGIGTGFTLNNITIYQGGPNPIDLSNITFNDSAVFNYSDGSGTAQNLGGGYAGSQMGGPGNVYCNQASNNSGVSDNSQCNGDFSQTLTNSLWFGDLGTSVGRVMAIGSGVNDPSTSGGNSNLLVSGNWVIGDTADIDSCVWHLRNDQGNCATTSVAATAASCSAGTITFTAANSGITNGFEFGAIGFAPIGYTGFFTATSANTTTVTAHVTTCPGAATTLGSIFPANAVGMTLNTAVDTNCVETYNSPNFFTVTKNSIVGNTRAVLGASGGDPNTGISCKMGSGSPTTVIPIRVYGYSAQQNYLASSSNQYTTNANTISPVQSGNYCGSATGPIGGTAGTVTGCATSATAPPSGWAAPTVSFSLGNLYQVGSTHYVPIVSPSFTAQYGAVQWLASTSSTAPISSDSRWSSNQATPTAGAGFNPNTYIPPYYLNLGGVGHGQTVYMWVMDSANHISAAAASVVVP